MIAKVGRVLVVVVGIVAVATGWYMLVAAVGHDVETFEPWTIVQHEDRWTYCDSTGWAEYQDYPTRDEAEKAMLNDKQFYEEWDRKHRSGYWKRCTLPNGEQERGGK